MLFLFLFILKVVAGKPLPSEYTTEVSLINPLYPNVSFHILHTLLYTFPLMLMKRIHLTIKDS